MKRIIGLLLMLGATLQTLAQTPDFEPEEWQAKFQSTYVQQRKATLNAAYSGANSLIPAPEQSYSFTATASLGLRLGKQTELYFNPEAAQGVPISNLSGLGGFTNGEMARTSGPNLSIYRARAFVRHTQNFDGESVILDSDANQLASRVSANRLVWTIGNVSVLDLFDDNRYSHDPRRQFLNWSLMTHGAYDFAADARGYTWGAAGAWYKADKSGDWVLRAGRFAQPKLPNQQSLDFGLFNHYGDQIELERGYRFNNLDGKWRALYFRNRAAMSRYTDALAAVAGTATAPDINNVRTNAKVKQGAGFNIEQALFKNVGGFVRMSWADGQTEAYAFTEIDRSLSFGVSVDGAAWSRSGDTLAIAMARNGLSTAHQQYLAAGGYGFFIGDGKLNYAPETIVETYYNLALTKTITIGLNWQRIANPAYNADRGPATVVGLRLHTQF